MSNGLSRSAVIEARKIAAIKFEYAKDDLRRAKNYGYWYSHLFRFIAFKIAKHKLDKANKQYFGK